MRHLFTSRRACRRAAIVACAISVAAGGGAAMAAAAPAGSALATTRAMQAQSSNPPPKPLLTIEEQAEDIIDRAPGKQWARIAKDIRTLKTARAAYQARAKADGIAPNVLTDFDGALARLTAAAKARQVANTLQAANDVSRATVELFGSYDIGHPVQIARLDVIGRQIGLDIDQKNGSDLQTQINDANAQWTAIRDEVTTRSSAVGEQVDGTLAALDEASATNKTGLLKAEVRVLLETVDALEELYT